MTSVLVSIPWAVLCGGLLYALVRAHEGARTERADLLQRIQAPEVAVAQHVDATVQGPPGLGYVPVDDDEAMRNDMLEQLGVAA